MKNIVYLCLCGLLLFSCSDDQDELIRGGNENIVSLPPEKPNDVINERVFELINLDYPGLENVKAFYEEGKHYYAAHALLKYYQNRGEVVNPNVNLVGTLANATDISIADQALDYRFYIRNFSESKEGGKDVYYSFKGEEGINWDYVPEEIKDQEFAYQKQRHQWMVPQAKTYRATKDEKYILSWKDVYGNWLKTYPTADANDKDMVWHGLQPASRVLDQVDLFQYYIQSKNFTPEWLSVFLPAFFDHVVCVEKGYYKDTSNIYLTQVASVISAGILMPEFTKSEEWLKSGMDKISKQVEVQFLADGVQNELDPSYHLSAIADFYDIYKLAQANNKLDLFPASYIPSLHKAARFVMDITYPDYSLDNFNDTRASSYSKSVLLKNFRRYAEMFPEDQEILWMATEGKQGKTPTELFQAYTASGYYMMRSNWGPTSTVMVLKNQVNPGNKWHSQPDNGTFGIYRNGRNFFPDAGVYSYGGSSVSNADRAKFAATKMHNTLTMLSANIKPGFMNGKLLKQEDKGKVSLFVTENKSYDSLSHRRAVFFVNKEFFVLVDEGHGANENTKVNLNFHLAAGEDNVVIDADKSAEFIYGAHTKFADNNNMLIKTFVETSQDYGAVNSVTEISDKLQVVSAKRKSYQVSVRKRGADKAARFITVIYPFKTEADFEKTVIEAKFIDNDADNLGTFHKEGAKTEITINGKKFNLSYTL